MQGIQRCCEQYYNSKKGFSQIINCNPYYLLYSYHFSVGGGPVAQEKHQIQFCGIHPK